MISQLVKQKYTADNQLSLATVTLKQCIPRSHATYRIWNRLTFDLNVLQKHISMTSVSPIIIKKEPQQSSLSLLNINYEVKERIGPWWKGAIFRKVIHKQVLKEISIHLKSGQITAILGNSGSGKTSLLDIITHRSSGKVTGQIYYNNDICSKSIIKQKATYVMQADRLLPNLTVRETLRYTARLKLPATVSADKVNEKVDKVIMEMGLKDVADTRIGSSIIRGISGGEQRRVTIAIQLLKDPEIVLLDEPTSGLDSYTARYLVSNLRDLSRRGTIVLLTIHQPSSDIFHLFDQIGIMSHGKMVYFGDAREMVAYFTTLGYPCDKYTNPLDRYVDVASIDRRDPQRERDSVQRVNSLVHAYKNSSIHIETNKAILVETSRPSHTVFIDQGTKRGPSYARVFLTILSRMYKNLFRDRKDYVARILLLPLFMVFILIFLGRLTNNQASIHDRIGLLYQSATVPPFMGIINSVALFPCLRDLYYRESRDGLYGTVTFLLVYAVHVIPFQILSSIIFSTVVYWATGMHPGVDHFGIYTLEIFIMHFWGEMVSVACLALFSNPVEANNVAALCQAASVVISSGFLKNVASLVKPLQWISWGLIHKYAGELFVVNEFQNLTFTCEENNTTCLLKGDLYIEQYYPDAQHHIARNFGAIGGYAVGTMILAMFAFKIRGLRNLH